MNHNNKSWTTSPSHEQQHDHTFTQYTKYSHNIISIDSMHAMSSRHDSTCMWYQFSSIWISKLCYRVIPQHPAQRHTQHPAQRHTQHPAQRHTQHPVSQSYITDIPYHQIRLTMNA